MKTFEHVVAEHGTTVLRVCRAIVGPADADDAWSETFLAAMRAELVARAPQLAPVLVLDSPVLTSADWVRLIPPPRAVPGPTPPTHPTRPTGAPGRSR